MILVIIAAALLFMDAGTGLIYHNESYYAQHGWPKLAGFVLAAAGVRVLSGEKRKSGGQFETQFEPQFMRFPVMRPTDHLFFLPVRYWPILLCGIGLVLSVW